MRGQALKNKAEDEKAEQARVAQKAAKAKKVPPPPLSCMLLSAPLSSAKASTEWSAGSQGSTAR